VFDYCSEAAGFLLSFDYVRAAIPCSLNAEKFLPTLSSAGNVAPGRSDGWHCGRSHSLKGGVAEGVLKKTGVMVS